MNTEYFSLSAAQVLAAFVLIGLAVALARLNRNQLERQYLIGAIRAFAQLWLMGYVLLWLFDAGNVWIYLLVLELMIVVGTYTACQRQEEIRRQTFFALWLALHASVVLVGGFFFVAVLQVNALDHPHLLIPLTGMVIGNCANGAALSVHRLRGELDSHRGEIEAALALGANPKTALQPFVAATLRNALIPSIKSMMLMGVVQMPGIMTGQMISGIVPVEAVRYQIVVVYLLAGTVALTCHLTVRLESRQFFSRTWALQV